MLLLSLNQVVGFVVMFGLTGLFWYPVIPMMLEFINRARFDADMMSINAYLIGMAELVGIGIEFVSGFLLKSGDGSFFVLIIVIVFAVFCLSILQCCLRLK